MAPFTDEQYEAEEKRLGRVMDQGCNGPGVLKVAISNGIVCVRWALPKALHEECASKSGLSFALNLASGHRGFTELKGVTERFEWVRDKALGADQWNRGLGMGMLLTGVISALHGLDEVCYGDHEKAAGKSYPWSKKSGRMYASMPGGGCGFNVIHMEACASKFEDGGTGALDVANFDQSIRRLMSQIDKRESALFLMSTCWKIETYDERTEVKEEPKKEEEIVKEELAVVNDGDDDGVERVVKEIVDKVLDTASASAHKRNGEGADEAQDGKRVKTES